ncbi:uncharacterized protein V6R79_019185 [Siganus canaliculatus]
MWIKACTLFLLLVCCFCSAEPQSDGSRRQSIWDDPIQFKTKANDLCDMIITGQGEYTRLRLSCQGSRRSYWCEYVGMPHTCRPYNKNPRHYFVQMMWDLRKLHNACQAPRQIKPHMCRNAADDSQMVFSSASFAQTERARPQPPAAARTEQAVKAIRVPQRVTSSPHTVTPPVESKAKRVARLYCWRSLQGVCSFIVGLFRD